MSFSGIFFGGRINVPAKVVRSRRSLRIELDHRVDTHGSKREHEDFAEGIEGSVINQDHVDDIATMRERITVFRSYNRKSAQIVAHR